MSSTGPPNTVVESESFPDLGRVTVTAKLEPGQRFGWTSSSPTAGQRPVPCPRCGIRPTRRWPAHDRPAGTVCWAAQRGYLDEFWARADVELDGDAEIQQAVRFSLFHVLQAGARAEGRAIPAKGLTGPGYDGHCFWDTEAYVLPVLTYVAPDTVAHALRWRHSTLPMATARAAQLGLARRRVPVAHHPRRRMLRLLAGGHGRLPRQRRHRRRRHPLPRRHR